MTMGKVALAHEYGIDRDIELLSSEQIRLLRNPAIYDLTSPNGDRSVNIMSIDRGSNPPLLRLSDVYHHSFHRNYKSLECYLNERVPIYKIITGDRSPSNENPKYTFSLGDESKVEVFFEIFKCRIGAETPMEFI